MCHIFFGNVCKSHPIKGFVRKVHIKQIILDTTGFELVTKRTSKRVLLDVVSLVVP